MSKFLPFTGYEKTLSLYQTQTAISDIKKIFQEKLSDKLNLKRVSAPLFVEEATGLNDDLNAIERAVSFDIKETKTNAAVVHSLAKWKRYALHKYSFPVGEGLYTDMNAIRRDEEMDNLHSIYVDQWDWEKVIDEKTRTLDNLKQTVQLIVDAICETQDLISKQYGTKSALSNKVSFVTTYQLEEMYPQLTPKERENVYLKEHKTAFVMQIGDLLKSGEKHDGRAPDYDDWALNGDILFWSDVLQCAFEVSSMGIRVSPKSLDEQLTKANADDRRKFMFHKMLLDGKLPLTMGGGIGQSRLCMLLLGKAHIGEVHVSVWDEATIKMCKENDIELL